jgi:hypothetical protein
MTEKAAWHSRLKGCDFLKMTLFVNLNFLLDALQLLTDEEAATLGAALSSVLSTVIFVAVGGEVAGPVVVVVVVEIVQPFSGSGLLLLADPLL